MGHIADIVSQKYGHDRELLVKVIKFYWKTLRHEMIMSDYDSIRLNTIGTFNTSTKMFRQRVRYDIKRLRYLRNAISNLNKEENPERYKFLTEREEYIKTSFRKIWKQFNKLKIKYYNIHQKTLEYKKQLSREQNGL